MINRKIFIVLSVLGKKDLKKIHELLESSYFGKNHDLIPLYNHILKHHPNFDSKELENEPLIKKLSPKKGDFTEAKLNKAFNRLYVLVEQHIVFEQSKKDKYDFYMKLMRFYLKYQVSLYPSIEKKYESLLASEDTRFEYYYHRKLLLEFRKNDYASIFDKRTGDINLQATSDALDEFFLVQKQFLLVVHATRKAAVEFESNLNLVEESKAASKLYEESNFALTFLELNLSLMGMDGNIIHFEKLMDLILDKKESIPRDLLEVAVVTLSNSAKLIFTGVEYYERLISIYEFQLNNDFINRKSKLFGVIVQNAITAAINLGRHKWARSFLEDKKEGFPLESALDLYNYNCARLAFEEQDFDEVLLRLNECHPQDIGHVLSVKRLYIKCFFEMKNYSLYESNSHAFNMYLRRLTANAQRHRDLHATFLKYCNRLFHHMIKPDSTKDQLNEIKEEILKEGILPEKKWLLEKANG